MKCNYITILCILLINTLCILSNPINTNKDEDINEVMVDEIIEELAKNEINKLIKSENANNLKKRQCFQCVGASCINNCPNGKFELNPTEKECFKDATGIDLDELASADDIASGAKSIYECLKDAAENIWKAPVFVAKYEICLIKHL